MKNKLVIGLAIGLFIFGIETVASASLLTTRSELDSLLGSNQTFEDFERLSLPYGGQATITGPLNSSTIFSGQGPGLVKEGVTYQSDGGNGLLWWNGNGYYNLQSQTLGDSSEWRGLGMEIIYTSFVNAVGFDMQNYSGYGMEGTVSVYDTIGRLLSTTNVNGGFFGWENISAGGIGSIFIAANDSNYIMIDNHGYGTAPVPEPAVMLLFGTGIAGLAGFRFRKKQ